MRDRQLFLFFIFITLVAKAQIGGRVTYQFLNLETSARNVALGGKVVTNFGVDPSSGLFNPATINSKMDKNYSLNYVNYLADINYGSASTAFKIFRQEKVIHAGIIYANYGTFEGYDIRGNATGDFTASEIAVSAGYGQKIPHSNFYVGGNLKVISSTLERYNSVGAAVDLGILYNKEKNNLTIGLSVRNLGTQITLYEDRREKLPLEINLGISKIPDHVPIRWFVNLQNLQFWNISFVNTNSNTQEAFGENSESRKEPSFFNNALRHVNLGVELFPRKAVNLRLGYNFRRSEELSIEGQRSFAGISAGFGIRVGKFTFNYAYARYNLAASTSVFGLNLNLSGYRQ